MSEPIKPVSTASTWLFSRRLWMLAVYVAALIGLISVASVAVLSASGDSYIAQATTQKPEKITELFFSTPQFLPKSVEPGAVNTFSYNLTNHQGTTVNYQAVVTIVENGKARTLDTRQLLVQNGDTRNVAIKFSTLEAGVQLELIVRLPNQGQEIHFRSHS